MVSTLAMSSQIPWLAKSCMRLKDYLIQQLLRGAATDWTLPSDHLLFRSKITLFNIFLTGVAIDWMKAARGFRFWSKNREGESRT